MLKIKNVFYCFTIVLLMFALTGCDGGEDGIFTTEELMDQNCDPTRPAISYQAASDKHSVPVQSPAGTKAPIPCQNLTYIGSTEPAIVIASDNTIVYAPAFTNDGIGLLKSEDYGVSWEVMYPDMPFGEEHTRWLPYLYMDRDTDRLFFLSSGNLINPLERRHINLSWTGTMGNKWEYLQVANEIGHSTGDWAKIFSGPPVTSVMDDYPNILYLTAISPISTPVPIVSSMEILTPKRQEVYRSMDGGHTWDYISTMNIVPEDVCGDPNEYVIYGSGSVGSDGTVYIVRRSCNQLSVAVSKDEGLSWEIKDVPGAIVPSYDTRRLEQIVQNPNILITELLTTDPQGNVYVIWADPDDSLRFSSSRDRGETWSSHVAVSAPEVINVRYGAIAAKEPGTIAISYYGSTDGVAYHGYIAETTNAFDPNPKFWSVTANDPAEPLFPWGFEVGYMGIINGNDLNEIVQVKYAPNGDIWASFVKDMCESATTSRCRWDSEAHANSVYQGVIGRAVHNVSDTWGTANTAEYPPPYDCAGDSGSVDACYTVAQDEGICPGIHECTCDNCSCELLECEEDPYCRAVRQCATDTGCRSWDCMLLCPNALFEAGELMSSMAIRVAHCALDAGCSRYCGLD